MAHIYDKTLETAMTGATWPELLWVGRDPEQPVWRVELQFRRGALAPMGLMGMRDVVRHRQGLWDYGTRWVSLRTNAGDSNRGRWPVAPEWCQLANACIGGSAVPLIRERVREADVRKLTQGLVGYASFWRRPAGRASWVGSWRPRCLPCARTWLIAGRRSRNWWRPSASAGCG